MFIVPRLKTWTRQEGALRLSEDDGPPAHSFLGDDEEQEELGGVYEEYGGGNRRESTPRVPTVGLQRPARTLVEVTSLEDSPPVPPPKDRA
jgi:hypothetical protein